ncbi:MAG: hypothetical protein RLN77_02745 [Rhodospirillales bacterium]
MAALTHGPGTTPAAAARGDSVFHDPARRDLAIQTGGMILLAAAVAFCLMTGFARRDIGPPVPASLAGVILPVPQPAAGLGLPDGAPLMGRWTLLCRTDGGCARARAALVPLGEPFQVLRAEDTGGAGTLPLIDPRGRVYARHDGGLPVLDLGGLTAEAARFFDRAVLARLF